MIGVIAFAITTILGVSVFSWTTEKLDKAEATVTQARDLIPLVLIGGAGLILLSKL